MATNDNVHGTTPRRALNNVVRGHLLFLTLLKKTFTRHSPDIPRTFPRWLDEKVIFQFCDVPCRCADRAVPSHK